MTQMKCIGSSNPHGKLRFRSIKNDRDDDRPVPHFAHSILDCLHRLRQILTYGREADRQKEKEEYCPEQVEIELRVSHAAAATVQR